MQFYDKNSWKKKIDPAFDKPIKTYVKYLRDIEQLPNDGQVTFNDESIELKRGSSPNRVGELTIDSRLYGLIIKG